MSMRGRRCHNTGSTGNLPRVDRENGASPQRGAPQLDSSDPRRAVCAHRRGSTLRLGHGGSGPSGRGSKSQATRPAVAQPWRAPTCRTPKSHSHLKRASQPLRRWNRRARMLGAVAEPNPVSLGYPESKNELRRALRVQAHPSTWKSCTRSNR